MATRIYSEAGEVILIAGDGTRRSIRSDAFGWHVEDDLYKVSDQIEHKAYTLGALGDIEGENGMGFDDVQSFHSYIHSMVDAMEADVSALVPITENVGDNPLSFDAWGRNKVYQDKSLLHGMFTYSVPATIWKEIYNDVEREPTIAVSKNGTLHMSSGDHLGDDNTLQTYRHPRYQPNRGHLYSNSAMLPQKTALGVREFGLFTREAGAFFRLKSDGQLYAVIRTTINNVTNELVELIDTTGVDLEKGNTYDIQFQWRGVGDYKFMINLKTVYVFDYLGKLSELSVFNPALPAAFRCKNLGDNPKIKAGCVDISSEGGGDENGKVHGSVSISNEVGQVAISGFNVPIIAIKSMNQMGGLLNTRDTIALMLSAYSDERAFLRVWVTRDFSAISPNDQHWKDIGDGHLEYIEFDNLDGTEPMSFDISKAHTISGHRVNKDSTLVIDDIFDGTTSLWITPGDMYIFTMHREDGTLTNVGCTFDFGEAI
ncbi:MAG: hypothetical protein KJO21_08635 [Verrucomicrobiae bacterium]|nr:hypothetical protein [Verrucomicrobiae bacterium]NNJ43540.1 hypothetical protein [Akkermansiaceae bacterium]